MSFVEPMKLGISSETYQPNAPQTWCSPSGKEVPIYYENKTSSLERTPVIDKFVKSQKNYSDYVKDSLSGEPKNFIDVIHKHNMLFNPEYGMTMYAINNFANAVDRAKKPEEKN